MTRSCSSTIAATCRSLWVSTPPTMRHTPSMTAIPSLQVDRASMASPGPNAWTGQSRDHEGQALLGSHESARQSLTARRSRAVDRSGERHGWLISVWVRPHRAPRGASLTGWSIAMRAGPPGNWRLSSDYHSAGVGGNLHDLVYLKLGGQRSARAVQYVELSRFSPDRKLRYVLLGDVVALHEDAGGSAVIRHD